MHPLNTKSPGTTAPARRIDHLAKTAAFSTTTANYDYTTPGKSNLRFQIDDFRFADDHCGVSLLGCDLESHPKQNPRDLKSRRSLSGWISNASRAERFRQSEI
jgi:hypothetical protein